MNSTMINEKELLTALFRVSLAERSRLFREFGPAADAIRVYESVKTRPSQVLSAESKLAFVSRKARKVIHVLADWQNDTGCRILSKKIEDGEMVEFIMDLDDFFNELLSKDAGM